MKINIASSALAAFPLIHSLHLERSLNKVYIPQKYATFESHLKANMPDLDTELCSAQDAKNNDLSKGADLLISFGFPYFIKPIANKTFNIHFGELPENRGPDPLFWTLKNGNKIAYVTIHEIHEDFDSGKIVSQKGYPVMPTDNYGLLNSRLGSIAIDQISDFIQGSKNAIAQNPEEAKYFPRPTDNDLMINWRNMTARQIEQLVNACNPNHIGARTAFGAIPIQFVEVFVHEQMQLEEQQLQKPAGQVIIADQRGLAVISKDKKALFISIVHMNEGTFSNMKLMQMGVNLETVFQ